MRIGIPFFIYVFKKYFQRHSRESKHKNGSKKHSGSYKHRNEKRRHRSSSSSSLSCEEKRSRKRHSRKKKYDLADATTNGDISDSAGVFCLNYF